MESTGIVKKLDRLGRVFFPLELRRILHLKKGDSMEIFMDGEYILLKKHKTERACAITGKVLSENKEFTPGLTLSPKGAQILFEKLKNEQV